MQKATLRPGRRRGRSPIACPRASSAYRRLAAGGGATDRPVPSTPLRRNRPTGAQHGRHGAQIQRPGHLSHDQGGGEAAQGSPRDSVRAMPFKSSGASGQAEGNCTIGFSCRAGGSVGRRRFLRFAADAAKLADAACGAIDRPIIGARAAVLEVELRRGGAVALGGRRRCGIGGLEGFCHFGSRGGAHLRVRALVALHELRVGVQLVDLLLRPCTAWR